ncbi:MAG: EamA family transporter RarD [Paracoccaceae bacterium]
MTPVAKGILAMIGACTVWGLSPIYYKQLSHVPPLEVLAHRTLWSFVFFVAILMVQQRAAEVWSALRNRRSAVLLLLGSVMVSINWFVYIMSIQIGRTTEASLGYYIFPLVTVLIARFVFKEELKGGQVVAVVLATIAVVVLTLGLGVAPWISLILAGTFAMYGAIKKKLTLGPVVSVTCEILFFLPIGLAVLGLSHGAGTGAFGQHTWDSALLILSGPLTAMPLILFSFAARNVALSAVGILQYLNPSLQFFCAVVVFGEPFGQWHAIAFALIWVAIAIFSVSALRQEKASRRAAMAAAGVSAQIRKSPSD